MIGSVYKLDLLLKLAQFFYFLKDFNMPILCIDLNVFFTLFHLKSFVFLPSITFPLLNIGRLNLDA